MYPGHIPQLIDNRYTVLAKLGKGGMGIVYKVKDPITNRVLALKMLSKEASKSLALEHFKQEFYYLTQLRHPNLVEVYDFGAVKDRYYFTMEYVEGRNLKTAVKGFSYEEVYPLIVQVCQALEYIHSKGIIHYDIKPRNILVMKAQKVQKLKTEIKTQKNNKSVPKGLEGTTYDLRPTLYAKLMDFGLAGETMSKSTGLVIKGTISYIAPEIIKGGRIDQRADLYSLGVMLYELVTEQLPFAGDTSVTLLKKHLQKAPMPPRKINANIPVGLQRVILKLLAKEPADRFVSANEVIKAFNEFSKEKFALETKETKASYILTGRFVGRNKELEKLKDAYTRLSVSVSPHSPVSQSPSLPVSSSPSLIMIGGESGIGKSRLLQEFRYQVQLEQGKFFLGRCYSSGNIPYQPFVEVLRQLVLYAEGTNIGLVKKYGAGIKKIMPELGSKNYVKDLPALVELKPQDEKLRLFSMVTEFIKGLKGNIVIGLEDLHWADETSLELLQYLARNLKSVDESGVFICGTYRIEEVSENHPLSKILIEELSKSGVCEILSLRCLTFEEISDLIRSILGTVEDVSGFAKRLLAETGGNPFFLEEVLKSIMEEVSNIAQDVFNLETIEKIEIPSTIRDALATRINRLDTESMRLLKIASVINRKFDPELLQHLENYNERRLYELIRGLVAKQVLVEERIDSKLSYNLFHTKLRDFVYEKLSLHEKRKLHQHIGEILEELFKGKEEEIIEELADHFVWGDNKEKAFHYLIMAGDKARKIYANQEAINYYTQALAITKENPGIFAEKAIVDIYEKRGDILVVVGNYKQAEDDYLAMLQITKSIGDREKEINALNAIGGIHFNTKDYKSLLRYCRTSYKKALKTGYQKGQAKSLGIIAELYFYLGKYSKALKYYKTGLKIYEDIGDKKSQAKTRHGIGNVYWFSGKLDHALAHFKKALEICEMIDAKREKAHSLHGLGGVHYRLGEYQLSLDFLKQSLHIFSEIGDRNNIAYCLHSIGNVFWFLGEFSQGLSYFNQALKIEEELNDKRGQALTLINIGAMLFKSGEYVSALNYYKQSLKLMKETGERSKQAINLFNIGVVYAILGKHRTALDYFGQGLKMSKELDDKRSQACLLGGIGGVYSAMGDYEQAISFFKQTLSIFKKIKSKGDEIEICLELGQVFQAKGNLPKVKALADEVMNWAIKSGSKDTLARVNLLQSRLLTETDPLKSIVYLRKSKDLIEELKDLELSWQVYYQEGRIYQLRGRLKNALDCYRKCVEIFKRICGKFKDEGLADSYSKDRRRKEVFKAIEEIEDRLGSSYAE